MSDPMTPAEIAVLRERLTYLADTYAFSIAQSDCIPVPERLIRAALALLDAQAAEIARLTAELERETRWRHQSIRYVRAIAIEDAARICDRWILQQQASNRTERAEASADCAAAIRALSPAPELPP